MPDEEKLYSSDHDNIEGSQSPSKSLLMTNNPDFSAGVNGDIPSPNMTTTMTAMTCLEDDDSKKSPIDTDEILVTDKEQVQQLLVPAPHLLPQPSVTPHQVHVQPQSQQQVSADDVFYQNDSDIGGLVSVTFSSLDINLVCLFIC